MTIELIEFSVSVLKKKIEGILILKLTELEQLMKICKNKLFKKTPHKIVHKTTKKKKIFANRTIDGAQHQFNKN